MSIESGQDPHPSRRIGEEEKDRVSRDMARIFPAKPRPEDRRARRPDEDHIARIPRRRRRNRAGGASWLAAAAIALAAGGLLATWTRPTLLPAAHAGTQMAALAPVPSAPPAAAPARIEAAGWQTDVTAQRRPAPEMVAGFVRPATVEPAPIHLAVLHPEPSQPAPRRAALVRSFEDPCDGTAGGARARCMHRDILAADERLRDAYDDAIRAGVSRATLISVRDRWARLRTRSNSNPDLVAAGYRRMARQLSGRSYALAGMDDGSRLMEP